MISATTPTDWDHLLTVREVAQMLHLHVNTVKRLGDRGDLPFVRVNSRGDRRHRRSAVEQLLVTYR